MTKVENNQSPENNGLRVLTEAFVRIGVEPNLGEVLYSYVNSPEFNSTFELELKEFVEKNSGRPALIININDRLSLQTISTIALDEKTTVLADGRKKLVIARLIMAKKEEEGKLILVDKNHKAVLLDLRSMLK
jgi:hypothetical protein